MKKLTVEEASHYFTSKEQNLDLVNIKKDWKKILGYTLKDNGTLKVQGCGMDMAFSVVDNLQWKLNEDYNHEFYDCEPNPFKLTSRIL